MHSDCIFRKEQASCLEKIQRANDLMDLNASSPGEWVGLGLWHSAQCRHAGWVEVSTSDMVLGCHGALGWAVDSPMATCGSEHTATAMAELLAVEWGCSVDRWCPFGLDKTTCGRTLSSSAVPQRTLGLPLPRNTIVLQPLDVLEVDTSGSCVTISDRIPEFP